MLQYTQRTYRVGSDEWYTLPLGTSTTLTTTLQRQFFIPIRIDNKLAIKSLGLEITTGGASSVFRYGIYNDAGKYAARPGTLIAEATATVTGASTGFIDNPFTVANSVVRRPGLYWLSVVNQSGTAAVVRAASNVESDARLSFGTTEPAAAGTVGAVYLASVSGAMADVSATASLVGAVSWPWLYFQVD